MPHPHTPATTPPALTPQEHTHYARQLLLPGFGLPGQHHLRNARVLVVGAGGLGSPVLSHLAAAGVGTLTIYDNDTVDATNMHRQLIHNYERLGMLKVDSAALTLTQLNPTINIEKHPTRIDATNVINAVTHADIVIDGTDNFASRYLLNDTCVALNTPYIWAAVYQYDAQLSVFATPHGPCYRCLHPTPPPPGSVPSCAEGGVLGVLPGHVGTAQATEAIKLLTGIGRPLTNRIGIYDALDGTWNYLPLTKNPTCPTCATPPQPHAMVTRWTKEFANDPTCALPTTTTTPPTITATHLHQAHTTNPPILIDVRTPTEHATATIPGSHNIPLNTILTHPTTALDNLPLNTKHAPLVLYCTSGTRSHLAAATLNDAGYPNAHTLTGGITAWWQETTP